MRAGKSLALLFLFSSPGLADTAVPAAALKNLIVGKTVLIGSSRAFYGADGNYTYDGAYPGKYRIDNGRICVDFLNGFARCDQIVKDAGNYYLINAQGYRYQFKPQ